MLLQVGGVVSCLNTQDVSLFRRAGGGAYNTKGVWVPGGVEAETTFTADVQAASGRMLQFVPEAERTVDHMSVWTTTVLQTTDERDQTRADIIGYRGKRWKVVAVVEDYHDNGFGRYLIQDTKQNVS